MILPIAMILKMGNINSDTPAMPLAARGHAHFGGFFIAWS